MERMQWPPPDYQHPKPEDTEVDTEIMMWHNVHAELFQLRNAINDLIRELPVATR